MLKYTGGGFGGVLDNIPARDLYDEEIERFGGEQALLESGIYAKPGEEREALETTRDGKTISGELTDVQVALNQGSINLNDGVSQDEASLAGRTLNKSKKG